ncbi:MAG: hypothetical protein D6732_23035 [Methanobacteriota archaeon]|nr:MAG: hypothetical protein D6732_23035 [Euryarchaeota archaeon]
MQFWFAGVQHEVENLLMKVRKTVRIALIIGLIALLGGSTFASAYVANSNTQQVNNQLEENAHYYTFPSNLIGIFYDHKDEVAKTTGEALVNSLSLMTPNVEGYEISSLDAIPEIFRRKNFDIAVYVFQSDANGLKINGNFKEISYSWSRSASVFNQIIDRYPNVEHVFAMGNTLQLMNKLNDKRHVHASQEEKVDAKLIYLYALWTLADILEARGGKHASLGNDIRMASLKFFANEFNDIAARNIEPESPLGEESPRTVEARKQRFFEEHPPKVEKIPRDGYVIDPQTKREMNPETGEIRTDGYGGDIFPIEAAGVGDFIVNLIPEETGLRGPVGGIVDTLLGFLIDKIGDAIGLDASTVNQIFDLITSIPDLVGLISDPSASKIKQFIDKLRPMLPIPQDLDPYIDLLIDGLFLLRGDGGDIQNFIFSAVEMLVPEDILDPSILDIIKNVVTLGQRVFDRISEGGNIIDIIFSVLNEQILYNVTTALVGNGTIFGMTVSEIQDFVQKANATISTIVNFISTRDIEGLIYTYGPDLLNFAFSEFNLDENYSEVVMLAVGILLTALGVSDDKTIEDQLVELLDRLTPIDLATIKAKAEEIVKLVGEAVETGATSLTDMQNSISTLLTELSIPASIADPINDLMAIVVAAKNVNLNTFPSFADMILNFAEGLGVPSQYTESLREVVTFVMGVVQFVMHPPRIEDILANILGTSSLSDLISQGIQFILNFVQGILPTSMTTQSVSNAPNRFAAIKVNEVLTAEDLISQAGDYIGLIFQVIESVQGNSVQGVLLSLLQSAMTVFINFVPDDFRPLVEVAKSIFGVIVGETDQLPSVEEVLNAVLPLLPSSVADVVRQFLPFIMMISDVFTNGFEAIFAQLFGWVSGLVEDLIDELVGSLSSALDGADGISIDFDVPLGVGSFSLFTIKLHFGLDFGLEFDGEAFGRMLFDLIFRGASLFSSSDPFDVLKTLASVISIVPIFEAGFEIGDFGSGSNSFLDFMLTSLGVDLSFSGEGWFKLQLFSFKNGIFSFDDFFKVLEWGFSFTITISRTFTLLDFLTGGAGGSLNAIGEYIGLDAISITIAFTLAFTIVKRAATANQPETGSMTITFTIGFTVSLGIDIVIAKLILKGTLEITLTLLQDLVAPTPLRVFIAIQLTITVTIGFLFFDWDFDYKWSPSGFEPPLGYELTSPTPEDAVQNGALGGDTDGDGLGDEYEKNTAGLNYQSDDTDGDTLSDKYETQTLKTDPASKDTDGDGLDDNVELDLKTNPLFPDTDFDGLTDYEEASIYGTNPLSIDTDEDGLDDKYEIFHSYNMTGITPSVSQIMIGGVPYDDRTDPLNPDTDGDGLLDGEEGSRGIYYGPELVGGEDDYGYTPDPPLIFNGGYTHPLDNDTDDDSYWQLYDGSIAPVESPYIMNLGDKVEIEGLTVILIDPLTGEPEPPRLIRTNPVNPDSDGDTGATAEDRKNPPFGFFMNSDGYELGIAHTDPLDGDTDDDGLIDGLEGILRPDSNHTDPLNPDTDGDGLGDMQELLLGTDARSVDSDLDGVTDSDEYFLYGTNPFLADTDSDGLEDGEELYLYHSSPFSKDSDADGLDDYSEVWKYFSDPMDEDSDNDGLTDFEEIKVYYTDPFIDDTDGDGLLDGEEIAGLPYTTENGTQYLIKTDPTKWDTDGDSLTTINQFGEMSMPMSDGQEFLLGTDPTRKDTDLDGLEDGWEMWLGKGEIPNFEPINLDPLSNDTDGDNLMDGTELVIANISTLLYPYVGNFIQTPFNTSAVNPDTDGDQLPDDEELRIYGTDPSIPDTDNDTISDYEELIIYGSDPVRNDTDGDGLSDPQEIFGFDPENLTLATNAILFTDFNKSDSDGDLLPDGAEVFFYNTDPTNQDENGNGIVDGMEIDTDGDGLFDGEEYYIFQTQQTPEGGGILQVDSDHDGLFDGQEVYETLTNPANWDSDNDTYSDGLEIYCGTNPNGNTTESEISACFAGLERVVILSPAQTTYHTNAIPVIVYDATGNMTAMEYRYKPENGSYSAPIPMVETSNPGYWEGTSLSLPLANGTYTLEVTITRPDLTTFSRTVTFTIDLGPGSINILTPEERTYSFNELQDPELPVKVEAGIEYTSLWFRIRWDNGSIYIDNTTLNFESGLNAYYNSSIKFPKIRGTTNYTIEVFGQKTNGEILVKAHRFAIKTPTIMENVVIVALPVVSIGAVAVVGKSVVSSGFKNPFKKRS